MARRQVLAIALAAALLALLALRPPGAPARGQPTATPAPAPPSAPPVYVLGPQPLVEAVERAGLNAVPITTADLSKIPNRSVVVVDWAQLETARGALNLTSPAVQALEGIFARGGLVLANSSDPVAAELLLSYAAARAVGVKFGNHHYLAAPPSSYQPDSSSTPVGSFTIDIGLEGLSITYEPELIGGPYISVSQSPWTSTTIGGQVAYNATWTFIYSGLYDISNS
ncbi:MAG: hypothetical protein JHC22_03915, partial [Thermoproteus sp.]|nr:hypothetical protein [Thermoproteus sp.]